MSSLRLFSYAQCESSIVPRARRLGESWTGRRSSVVATPKNTAGSRVRRSVLATASRETINPTVVGGKQALPSDTVKDGYVSRWL
eukprot:5224163-Pyramimonas_sp.AAC.2